MWSQVNMYSKGLSLIFLVWLEFSTNIDVLDVRIEQYKESFVLLRYLPCLV